MALCRGETPVLDLDKVHPVSKTHWATRRRQPSLLTASCCATSRSCRCFSNLVVWCLSNSFVVLLALCLNCLYHSVLAVCCCTFAERARDRKIFSCCWKLSVKPLQYFCHQLPMSFLIDQLCRLLFWQKMITSDNNIILVTLSRLITSRFVEIGIIIISSSSSRRRHPSLLTASCCATSQVMPMQYVWHYNVVYKVLPNMIKLAIWNSFAELVTVHWWFVTCLWRSVCFIVFIVFKVCLLLGSICSMCLCVFFIICY